jgi:LEA14-like dessication related protein
MRRRELLRTAAVLAAAAPAAGCQTLLNLIRAGIRDPEVRITRMSLEDVQLDRVRMLFDTVLKNPNPFGLNLAGLGYAISIEGDELAKGNMNQGLNLKANGSSSMRFPVELTLGSTSKAILSLLTKNEVGYGIKSAFQFAFQGEKLTVPVNFTGRFPVPKLPLVDVRDVAFTAVGPGGIGMRVLTRMRNTNPFELPIDAFRFKIELNGRSVLRNEIVNAVRLASGQTRDVPLDFTFSLVDAGLSLASLAQRPTLQWKVLTNLESGILKVPFEAGGRVRLA